MARRRSKRCRKSSSNYNSLFIHGGCGLGKTHLLQAICNHFREFSPNLRWRYVTGEEFTNDYIYAVRNAQMGSFHERYRGLDALVIDDVHFLANNKATQDGFLHVQGIDACGKKSCWPPTHIQTHRTFRNR
jgi:chromosomal replication initiator protein